MSTTLPESQVCTRCNLLKPLTEFYKQPLGKYGRHSRCKDCERERARRYYDANPDKYSENNRRWRETNSDKRRADMVVWREANPNRVRENNRRWRETNPDKVRSKTQRRRAVKLNAQVDEVITFTLASECVACHATDRLTEDHIIPLSRGGAHADANLQTLCTPCNSSKKELTMEEWIVSSRPRARRIFGT